MMRTKMTMTLARQIGLLSNKKMMVILTTYSKMNLSVKSGSMKNNNVTKDSLI
jgi:hypothetical protein